VLTCYAVPTEASIVSTHELERLASFHSRLHSISTDNRTSPKYRFKQESLPDAKVSAR